MNRRAIASILHHLRPAFWPFVWLHFLLGFLMAAGEAADELPAHVWLQGIAAGGIWAICLGGAATAIDAVFRPSPGGQEAGESSEGDVPTFVGWVGAGFLLAGLILSPALHWRFLEVYLVGLVLVVLHCVPPVRLGRILVGEVVLQAAGYGALTLCAGYIAFGKAPMLDRVLLLHSIGFGFLLTGMRAILWRTGPPSAHLPQANSPAARREFPRLLPLLYLICIVNGFVCFGMAEGYAGGALETAVLGIALLGWGTLGLFRFMGRSPEESTPGIMSGLGAWLLTDAAIAVLKLVR